jgi:hypothetical protein
MREVNASRPKGSQCVHLRSLAHGPQVLGREQGEWGGEDGAVAELVASGRRGEMKKAGERDGRRRVEEVKEDGQRRRAN